jgi:Tol biopolymer transport system component
VLEVVVMLGRMLRPCIAWVVLVACGGAPSGGGVGSVGPTPLAHPPASAAASPAVGPAANGAIAFVRVRPAGADGEPVRASLWVLESDGGARRLAGDVAALPPSWSPDGAYLAARTERGIEVFDASGATRRLVAGCAAPRCLGLGPPSWSPDGDRIAFAGDLDGADGVWTVPADGGGGPRLLAERSIRGAPAWSPDGATVAVITDEVELLDAATGAWVATAPLPGRVLADAVAWTPDGRLLVTIRVEGDDALVLVTPDGAVTAVGGCPGRSCEDVGAVVAPDGGSALFTRARCDVAGGDCSTGELLVARLAGGRPRVVATDGGRLCCAAWQPLR